MPPQTFDGNGVKRCHFFGNRPIYYCIFCVRGCFVFFSTTVGDCFTICFPFCLVSWIVVCASDVLVTFSQILKNHHILSDPLNILLTFYF